MSARFETKLLAGYSNLYGQPTRTIQEYLEGISKEMLLKCATFFLGFYNQNSKYNNTKAFLEMYFCRENQEFVTDLWGRIKRFGEESNSDPTVVSFDTSLRLYEFVYDNVANDSVETKSKVEKEQHIFLAYLLINDQVVLKNNISIVSTQDLEGDKRFIAQILSISCPYSDFINYNIDYVLACQIIRAVSLFEFLENKPETKLLLSKFLEYYSCQNWKEYLKRILPLAFSVIKKTKEAHVEITIPDDEFYEMTCSFIDKLAINDRQVIQDYDYKSIRNKPLQKVDRFNYRIVYGLFMIEKIYKGLYFKLSEINNSLNAQEKFKDLNSYLRDNFSEREIVYNTLNYIYENRYIKRTGEQLKANGMNGEPDYYIRNNNKIFLFESKDVLLNAEVKISYDFSQYEPEFKKKFYYDDTGPKLKKKALIQILNNIKLLLTKSFPTDKNYNRNNIRIYPIIITHDRQFDLVGLNLLLKEWFSLEIKKIELEGVNVLNIKQIVVINIDTLIQYQDLLKANYFTLNEVLDSYLESTDLITQKDREGKLKRNVIFPFSFFIEDFVNNKRWPKFPKQFAEKGFSLFADENINGGELQL